MLDDPDAVFTDMRNDYEYEVGHFRERSKSRPALPRQLPKRLR